MFENQKFDPLRYLDEIFEKDDFCQVFTDKESQISSEYFQGVKSFIFKELPNPKNAAEDPVKIVKFCCRIYFRDYIWVVKRNPAVICGNL